MKDDICSNMKKKKSNFFLFFYIEDVIDKTCSNHQRMKLRIKRSR